MPMLVIGVAVGWAAYGAGWPGSAPGPAWQWYGAATAQALVALVGWCASAWALRGIQRRSALPLRTAQRFFGLAPLLLLAGFVWQLRSGLDWAAPGAVLAPVLAMVPTGCCAAAVIAVRYPMDRRLYEADLFRRADAGLAIYPPASFGRYVVRRLRDELLALAAPLVLLATASVGVMRVVEAGGAPEPWPTAAGWASAGVVFALTPLLLVRVWRTTPATRGEVGGRLQAIAERAGFAKLRIRLWHTDGGMINALAMGLLPRFRFVLLTDGLIERLTARQTDLVLAHELGHIRRGHLVWLLVAALGAGVAAELATWAVARGLRSMASTPAWFNDDALLGLAVVLWLSLLGVASRRFERQADAFAVVEASREEDGGLPSACSAVGARDYAGTLAAVGEAHHASLRRWTWRHGSLAGRMERAMALVGQRPGRTSADRSAGWVKVLSLLMLAVGVAWWAWLSR
ncbi:MAG: M48 family metalloprotease [Planctomycetota bacterium]